MAAISRMIRVTSCSASHTSCRKVFGGFGGITLEPKMSRLRSRSSRDPLKPACHVRTYGERKRRKVKLEAEAPADCPHQAHTHLEREGGGEEMDRMEEEDPWNPAGKRPRGNEGGWLVRWGGGGRAKDVNGEETPPPQLDPSLALTPSPTSPASDTSFSR